MGCTCNLDGIKTGHTCEKKRLNEGEREKNENFALFMCISRILGRSNKSIDKRAAAAKNARQAFREFLIYWSGFRCFSHDFCGPCIQFLVFSLFLKKNAASDYIIVFLSMWWHKFFHSLFCTRSIFSLSVGTITLFMRVCILIALIK